MRTILLSLILAAVLLPSSAIAQDRAHTFMVRGLAAVEMARNDDELAAAIEEFKKATEIDPTLTVAWYNMGKIQAKTGQLKDAVNSFNRYLSIAPQAEDAAKVRDEIIKLEYRIENQEKIQSLSGTWDTADGLKAQIDVSGSKISIRMQQITFPQSTEVWMYDDLLPQQTTTFDFRNSPVLRLELRGNKLTGTIELTPTTSLTSDNWCTLPGETGQVSGIMGTGKIELEIKKQKFKVVMNSNDGWFASTRVRCDGVTPTGEMVTKIILSRPAEK